MPEAPQGRPEAPQGRPEAPQGRPESGPSVVALGGGHGLAAALCAVREYAGSITAVVSVADDGGSSGRLRRDLDVVPPGDLRKCLVALSAPDNVWSEAFEHRFGGSELGGHALGNLVLVGLTESLGDVGRALDEAGRVLGATGRVRPATMDRVVLKAQIDAAGPGGSSASVEGQVAVMEHRGRIRRVTIVPADARAHPEAIAAIAAADQVVLAPGSLFTSLLPVLVVPELRDAIAATSAQVVQVSNLEPQMPETEGLDAVDHLRAVLEHGARVDVLLAPSDGTLPAEESAVEALGVRPVCAPLAVPNGHRHDPARLAKALADLLES
jgi:uncharacterized cofD-like protein